MLNQKINWLVGFTITLMLTACGGGGAPSGVIPPPAAGGNGGSGYRTTSVSKYMRSSIDVKTEYFYEAALSFDEELLVLSTKENIRFFNISKPDQPKAISQYPYRGAGDIAVSKDNKTLFFDHGVLDISSLSNIRQTRKIQNIFSFNYSPKDNEVITFNPGVIRFINPGSYKNESPYNVFLSTVSTKRTIKNVALDTLFEISDDKKRAYGTGYDDNVFKVVNITNNQAITEYQKTFEYEISGIAVSKDQTKAYIIERYTDEGLRVIDISSHDQNASTLSTLPFEYDARDIWLSPNGTTAYVSYVLGMFVIDISDDKKPMIKEHIQLEKDDTFSDLIISADGHTGYIRTQGIRGKKNGDDRILIIDLPQ